MTGLNKGLGTVEVTLRWDPNPAGEPSHDLDIVAATFTADDPRGAPDYLVHFGSRSPDGTITLARDSRTGRGFGPDEALRIEFERLAPRYVRVVVGVAIQQGDGRITFGEVLNGGVQLAEVAPGVAPEVLADHDFAAVAGATAATVGEFLRGETGEWHFRPLVRGFDADPETFGRLIGGSSA